MFCSGLVSVMLWLQFMLIGILTVAGAVPLVTPDFTPIIWLIPGAIMLLVSITCNIARTKRY